MLADPLDRELPRPARAFAFVTLLALMCVGPCGRQILGVESDFLRPWRMFRRAAVGAVEARFHRRLPDGSDVELDRFRALGYATRSEAPGELRRIVGMQGTWEVARALCESLGEGADVRVTSRVASLEGWEPGYSGRRNLCALEAPETGDDP